MADEGIARAAAEALGLASIACPAVPVTTRRWRHGFAPMGMIFVPSVGGISHSPRELTTWVDCARGADVLLETILLVDKMTDLA